jgi:type I restriction enzyme M protein
VAEIADAKNDYNLNLPRYIDSSEAEDLQDITGHLRGGIPERDLDALACAPYWQQMPGLRKRCSSPPLRPGYAALTLPLAEVKPAILGHAEFTAFNARRSQRFAGGRPRPQMRPSSRGHPKALIESCPRTCSPPSRNARCSTPTTSTST